jgi:hypothetical protein
MNIRMDDIAVAIGAISLVLGVGTALLLFILLVTTPVIDFMPGNSLPDGAFSALALASLLLLAVGSAALAFGLRRTRDSA